MNLEDNIARMEQELADMKRQLEEQKCEWEMKPADWRILSDGDIIEEDNCGVTDIQSLGMKRHTKELAELSVKRMKQSNLLEYWAMVIDPDWRDDGFGTQAWFIYQHSSGMYFIDWDVNARNMSKVYMSEKAATEICNALNSGELVLE